MRPPILILCTLLVLLCVARHAAAYQHITNGGFEQGLAGWSPAPTTDLDVASAPEVAPAEGSASARITLGDSDAIVRQRVSDALPAGAFELRAQLRSPDAATVTLSILLAGSPQQIVVSASNVSNSWTEVGGAFSLNSAEEVVVSITVSGARGSVVYLDDVRLDGAAPVTLTPTRTATPTPTAVIAAPTATPVTGSTGFTSTSTPPPSATVTSTPLPFVDIVGPDVRNGGFEQVDDAGVPLSWEKFGGTLTTDGRARGGARAARLDSATASTKWLHQAVTVEADGWYAFDAWLEHDDPGIASTFLRVSWYASLDGSGTALRSDDSAESFDSAVPGYRRLATGAVAPPPGARSARVRVMLVPVSSAQASLIVDDVAWTRVAAPAEAPPGATSPSASANSESNETEPRSTAARVRRTSASAAPSLITGAPPDPSAGVVINEILYDDASSDVSDAEGEWIELYNRTDLPLDLTGWSLRDAVSAEVLPQVTVPARSFAILAASDAFATTYGDAGVEVVVLGGRLGNGLGNDGDRLLLVDPTGAVADAVSWGLDTSVFTPSIADVPSGHSIERRLPGADSDSASDFVDNERPSPGQGYDPSMRGRQTQDEGRTIDVLAGSGARDWGWLPWALAAASMATCGGVIGWRAAFAVRQRLRHS